MGHLSVLIWIKVHSNYNTLTGFGIFNFTIFDQKNKHVNCFKKVIYYKSPSAIRNQDSNIHIFDLRF